jgi:hypothetical protein
MLVDMYITYPPGKKTENAILFMTDVYGLKLVQNRLYVTSFTFLSLPQAL